MTMTQDIKIDIKRSGFPVKVGTVELWFDSSIESMKNFFNIEEVAHDKLNAAIEKAEHIHFPDSIDKSEDLAVAKKNSGAVIDLHKEFIAAQYDILFGDGTFKKIYEEYPDVIALEDLLKPLGEAIAEKIEEQEKERKSEVEKIKNEYLKKKEKKKRLNEIE